MPEFALEPLLTSSAGFAQVKASPLQRATWRIGDGQPWADLLEAYPELPEQLTKAAGPGGFERLVELEGKRPREFYVLCGIRTSKSVMTAGIALRSALTVDLSGLLPWEEAAYCILSLSKKKAKIVLRHLLGPLHAQPKLRKLLARDPTTETVWIRRPDKRVVRIEIIAGAAAGGSLVGDWSAGVAFDEFPRMSGDEDAKVINFDASREAVLGRLVPGAQVTAVGSPYAPSGPAYEAVKAYWGNPTEEVILLRPFAGDMNPTYWTEKRVEGLRKSPKGAHVLKTDYLGEFASPESSFFTVEELDPVTRKVTEECPTADIPAEEGVMYFAAIDPAMARNAWTLVVGSRSYRKDGSVLVRIVLVRQWEPLKMGPLNPRMILAEMKRILEPYRVVEVYTDRWKSEELAAMAQEIGLTLTVYGIAGHDSVRMFDSLRLRVLSGGIELHPSPELRVDLLGIRRVVRNRNVAMELPFTNDGRHCDYAPALAVVNEAAALEASWVGAMGKLLRTGGTVL